MQNDNLDQKQRTTYSIFYPLILVVMTILIKTVFQSSQLFQEEANLAVIKSNQEQPLEESRKVRSQFDAIATETAKLAAQGNQNASFILGQLKKQGITVNLPSQLSP